MSGRQERYETRRQVRQAAKGFRKAPTPSEALLWQKLRGNQLGVKFRRQHPIGPFVADFCCPELRLVVEIDGSVHEGQEERDMSRQRAIEQRGFHVMRLQAGDVESDLAAAVAQIVARVQDLLA